MRPTQKQQLPVFRLVLLLIATAAVRGLAKSVVMVPEPVGLGVEATTSQWTEVAEHPQATGPSIATGPSQGTVASLAPATTSDGIGSKAADYDPYQQPKHRAADAAITATASLGGLSAPITKITCKLDVYGNVADVVVVTSGGTRKTLCGTGAAQAPGSGGRNVELDFTDYAIVQVTLGKLTSAPNGPVSWLSFRTAVHDIRSCGNVQISSSRASTTLWSAQQGNFSALSSFTPRCSHIGKSKALVGLVDVDFDAPLPPPMSFGTNVPSCCTSVLSFPIGDQIPGNDTDCCLEWIMANKTEVAASSSTTCTDRATPQLWQAPISRQQLPLVRPPDWPYRKRSTAVTNVKLTRRSQGDYVTAQIQHSPIPGVTSAMARWWFNGNEQGDAVLNGVVYPRYLLWHPRDHVNTGTIYPGPNPGNATGSKQSVVQFLKGSTGYTRSSSSWDSNFWTSLNHEVYEANANNIFFGHGPDFAPFFAMNHSWVNTGTNRKPALQMNSTIYIGMQPPRDDPLAPIINPISFKIVGGDCIQSAVTAMVDHTIEEMGNFQYFLPLLFSQQPKL